MSRSTGEAVSIYGALDRALQRIEAAAAIVGGIFMLSAMVLTSADAIMRYAFNAPLTFNYYLTEKYLLVGLMTMPMAWGFRTGGYIRIVFLSAALPAIARHLLVRLGLLVSCAYVTMLAWLSGVHTLEVYISGDVQMGVIDWPVYLSWIWLPIGLGLLAIRLLFIAIGSAATLQEAEGTAMETDL